MKHVPPPDASPQIRVRRGDLNNASDQQQLLMLLNVFAAGQTGSGSALPKSISRELIPGLQAHPTTVLFLAERMSHAVGMAVCFVGFSTFKAKPLINIHDLAVHPDYRSSGVGSALIETICDFARDRNYCAVTLEVQADNPARRLYARYGFGVSCPAHDRTMLFGKLEIQSS